MRVLLTGKTGQVGYELERSLQSVGEIIAPGRTQMDLSNLTQVRDVIRSLKPDLIVNAAAYTDVDKAETEPKAAMRINGEAPTVMAEEAKRLGSAIIHYSTDYVFDGAKATPYTEEDATSPINVYGHTKRVGELGIQEVGIPYLILRTSWVYGIRGKNFLTTVVRLAQERSELSIVNDQHGAPTWSRTIADATANIVAQSSGTRDSREWWQNKSGLYHLTAQGKTTWYGFAIEILKQSPILEKPQVIPITTKEYPALARRPSNSQLCSSRLLNTFCCLPTWQNALRLCRP